VLERRLDSAKTETIKIHDLEINRDAYTVFRGSDEVSLSRLEFELLYFLASHVGKVYSRASLLQRVWNNAIIKERTVDVHIRRLRKALGEDYIETLKGVGYKFRAEN
ncbi:MAG: winged helix-turn-helix domain-containing protein, partial [Bacteroidota bacterium]